MVKTRGSGESSAPMEYKEMDSNGDVTVSEQENEPLHVKELCSKGRKKENGSCRSLPLSNDTNRCNSRASGSLYSAQSPAKNDTDDDDDDSSYRAEKPKKKAKSRAYTEPADFLDDSEIDEVYHSRRRSSGYGSLQSNVRRSKRQPRPIHENVDESRYDSYSPSFEYKTKPTRRSTRERGISRSATMVRQSESVTESSDADTPSSQSARYREKVSSQHSYKEKIRSPRSLRNQREHEIKREQLNRRAVESPTGSGEDLYSRVKRNRRNVSSFKNRSNKDMLDEGDLPAMSAGADDSQTDEGTDKYDNDANGHGGEDELSQIVSNTGEHDEEDKKEQSERRKEDEDDQESSSDTEEDSDEQEVQPRRSLRKRPKRRRQEESDASEAKPKTYQLRQRRAPVPVQTVVERKERRVKREPSHPFSREAYVRRNKKHGAHHSSTDTSSSSDETSFQRKKDKKMTKARGQCLPMNFKEKDLMKGLLRDRQRAGASLADIDPMAIDKTVLFDKIGGLDNHVKSLKEMILFPLLYPEIFEKYKIQPPRGVLFHGPPGTGKTLVARALANECSTEGKKVAFFMRKGADCLSKWVGESERQLRLLFDQAYSMRPSIIFFDEIDGIAPVRSTRQDQIHSSIVSTLLALMDGLDCRGEVVIIGATNRIDAIDPALRRPGRFDREFFFPLPSFESRNEILTIHTKEWEPPLPPELIGTLASRTTGYCGADLKALCAETALISLRRRYPQIYNSKNKLLLNINEVKIELRDFNSAIKKIIPATERASPSASRPLNSVLKPLLNRTLKRAVGLIEGIFPAAVRKDTAKANFASDDEEVEKHLVSLDDHLDITSKTTRNTMRYFGNCRPRFIIYGEKDRGHSSHLAPALLHSLEHLSHLKLDTCTLYSVTTRTPEEALVSLFSEALKRLPAILYIPHINSLWNTLSETLKLSLVNLLDDLESSTPLLILATCDSEFENLDDDLRDIFCGERSTLKSMAMPVPSREERQKFFEPLFKNYAIKPVEETRTKESVPDEVLPEVVTKEAPKLTEVELKKLRKKENAVLRELRLFLRDVLAKIVRDKRFSIFVQPVDIEEVPDYFEVIKNPMDLERMMAKIDDFQYECAEEFLKDIELIVENALEYNPNKDSADKQIRHRSYALKDYAYALLNAEMDSDFETYCQEIVMSKRERGESRPAPLFSATAPPALSVPLTNADEDTEIESVKSSGQSVASSAGSTNKDGTKKTNGKRSKSKRKKSSKRQRKSSEENVTGEKPDGECTDVKNDDEGAEDCNPTNAVAVVALTDVETPVSGNEPSVVPAMEVESNCNGAIVSNGCASSSASNATVVDEEPTLEKERVVLDEAKLELVLDRLIEVTDGAPVEQLERLYWTLFRVMQRNVKKWDRTAMVKELKIELDFFVVQQNGRLKS